MHQFSKRTDRRCFATSMTGTIVMVTVLAIAAAAPACAQGIVDGFMRGGGNVTAAISYSYERYSQYFVGNDLAKNPLNGETPNPSNTGLGTISTQSIALYAACGITNDVDVIVSVPHVKAHASDGYWSDQSTIQDISAAVKWRALSLDAGFARLDAICAAGISLPATNYVIDAPVAVGHGATGGEGRILVHATHSSGAFATLNAGYIRRSIVSLDRGFDVAVPDAVDLSAKAGFASSFLTAGAWINRQNSQGGTNIGPGVPFPGNRISYTRVGLDAYVPLTMIVDGLGVSVGGAMTLDGSNVGKSTRISGGIVYSRHLF